MKATNYPHRFVQSFWTINRSMLEHGFGWLNPGLLIGGAVGGILATAGVEQLLDFLIEITFNQEESDNQDNQDNP